MDKFSQAAFDTLQEQESEFVTLVPFGDRVPTEALLPVEFDRCLVGRVRLRLLSASVRPDGIRCRFKTQLVELEECNDE